MIFFELKILVTFILKPLSDLYFFIRLKILDYTTKKELEKIELEKENELKKIDALELGLISYKEAYSIQRECMERVKSKSSGSLILFLEHKPVFTLGRAAKKENLLIN